MLVYPGIKLILEGGKLRPPRNDNDLASPVHFDASHE
jgi:hypothetical protein